MLVPSLSCRRACALAAHRSRRGENCGQLPWLTEGNILPSFEIRPFGYYRTVHGQKIRLP